MCRKRYAKRTRPKPVAGCRYGTFLFLYSGTGGLAHKDLPSDMGTCTLAAPFLALLPFCQCTSESPRLGRQGKNVPDACCCDGVLYIAEHLGDDKSYKWWSTESQMCSTQEVAHLNLLECC
eukprot:1140454-Pelagomonas_calceolata.AAC.2